MTRVGKQAFAVNEGVSRLFHFKRRLLFFFYASNLNLTEQKRPLTRAFVILMGKPSHSI